MIDAILLVNQLMNESSLLYDSQDYKGAICKLAEAWNALPDDKYQYKESYHIIQRILSTAIVDNNREAMINYLPHIFHASPNRPDYGGREFWAGKVYYNLGDFEKAYYFFKIAYSKSHRRCFNDEDSKYQSFYDSWIG
jgi:tetratricopeptide (TPR) repeat protein